MITEKNFIRFTILLIFILLGCSEKNRLINENEEIARSFIEAWSEHNGEKLASLFANDCKYEEIPSGRTFTNKSEISDYVTNTASGMPDMKETIINIISNEQFAVIEYIMKGTNTNGWPNIPVSNRYFELKVLTILEIEERLIKECRDYWDWDTFKNAVSDN